MAIETLRGVKELNGLKIMDETDRPVDSDGLIDWVEFDEMRKEIPVCIDHNANMISFKIQNGPIKENGLNGCQVSDMILIAKEIITGLNNKFPCRENAITITKLDEALMWQKERTFNRTIRGVEGLSKK